MQLTHSKSPMFLIALFLLITHSAECATRPSKPTIKDAKHYIGALRSLSTNSTAMCLDKTNDIQNKLDDMEELLSVDNLETYCDDLGGKLAPFKHAYKVKSDDSESDGSILIQVICISSSCSKAQIDTMTEFIEESLQQNVEGVEQVADSSSSSSSTSTAPNGGKKDDGGVGEEEKDGDSQGTGAWFIPVLMVSIIGFFVLVWRLKVRALRNDKHRRANGGIYA